MRKILVIEDDTLFNRTLSYYLREKGYDVDSAFSILAAKEYVKGNRYDLIVLDINLPDGNGFDLCVEIKSRNKNILLIFLTANDIEEDMLRGYELGADDYVTKPFPMNVFIKKIEALFSRMEKNENGESYEDEYLKINFIEMCSSLNGIPIDFTPMEYRTLKLFISNRKKVLTRQVLLERLWDIDGNYVDEHTLTTNISRIRSKIERNGLHYIKTVYGMGYMWVGGETK